MPKYENDTLLLRGQTYRTVKINDKIWMAQNLAIEVEGSWAYDNDINHTKRYGRLYTWDAAMKNCPEGWHLPTDEEWTELIENLGGTEEAFSKLIEGGSSGFDLLFAGYLPSGGSFMSIERTADFWSSTESGSNVWIRYIVHRKTKVFRSLESKSCGYSVRYIKD